MNWREKVKRTVLFLAALTLLLGSCVSAPPPEETQPTVTAMLNANTPAGEIIPGDNVELMKFDVATSGNISVGNFQATWQELKEPTNVSVQHLRLLRQDTLLDTTIEVIPYGEPTILLKDSSVQLDSQTITTFSLKGDVAGEGNFSLTVSFEAYSSTEELLSVESLPLTGGILIVNGAPVQQSEPSVKVTATLDGEPWEGSVIFDLSRNASFDGMDATGQYQVPKEFTGLYSDLPKGANVYIRLRQPEGFQSGPETAYLYGIVATNYGESDGAWIGPCPTPVTFTFVFKTLPSLTVLSPNGGEQWVIGETYQVTWKSQGLDTVAGINLIDYTPGDRYDHQYGIASMVPASSGKYSWTIPSHIMPGANYKVVVGYEEINDFSDDYFSIIAPEDTGLYRI